MVGRLNKYARLEQASSISTVDKEISEDNVGHKLLRNLGWQQGNSLGSEGTSGIIEPIRGDQGKLTSKDRRYIKINFIIYF